MRERKNPANLMKLLGAKKRFESSHPRFAAFLKAAFEGGIKEDTILEISIQTPGQQKLTTNLKVTQSDLELLELLREMNH